MFNKTLALVVAIVCVVLLIRLVLPQRQRWRLDAAARRATQAVGEGAARVWRWRASRKTAQRLADDAIQRARGGGVERDGNVYRPKSFREPRRSRGSRETRSSSEGPDTGDEPDTPEPRKPH